MENNGMDLLLNQLIPGLIAKVKGLERRVAELEAQKTGIEMFLNQLAPKLVEKIKTLEHTSGALETRLTAMEEVFFRHVTDDAPKPKAKRGRPRKAEEPAPVVQEAKPVPPTPPAEGFSLDDIRKLAAEGKRVDTDVQLWFFNGQKKTAREFGFADILDLPLGERVAAFKARGFITADGSIPSPAFGG